MKHFPHPITMALTMLAMFSPPNLHAQTPQFPYPISINSDQTISVIPTPKGDRISDFSTVGYNYGNTPLPDELGGYAVPVVVTLSPGSGDQTDRIQAAIDFISARSLVNGFRGALLLKAGRWDIYSVNKIAIKASGVVIRGEGDHPLTGTRIFAMGTTNENDSGNTRNSRLISFAGNGNTIGTTRTLVDAVYVPSGVTVIPITAHPFTVNQRVQVRFPGTIAWQKASFYNTAATADADPAITFNRIVTAVTANSITLDAPITTPLDPAYGAGYVVPVTAFSQITNVGVSSLYFESAEAGDTDENHLWNALDFTNVEDGFVHDCTARYFAYSIAYVNTSTRKITIDRSQVHDGISQLVGGRRYHFVLTGEMGLVSNAVTRYGRHSFIINWPAAPGPNVFVDGYSSQSYNESGSHADWNNGGLWDNITTLNPSTSAGLQVKLERPSANCVAWNCVTNNITFENMPLSPNWSFGTTNASGGAAGWINSISGYALPFVGKGEQWSNGTRMPIRSLYEKQVETRLKAARNPYRYQAGLPTRINYPPIIRTPTQLVALSGSSFSYQLPVSNIVAATSTPNYTATGLPSGVTCSATTGIISGTLPTILVDTNYTLSLTARNLDGTTTKAMTLTVRPAGSPKIPLTMNVEVDVNLTTPLPISGTTALPVPMVPGSRLLAPMIVRKSYISDINSTAYTTTDVPVPVRGVLSLEGLTSPVAITYNGSTTVPTAIGSYSIVATLNDPIYSASATGTLLITTGTAVTVTLANTTAPTAASPVTATSTQPSLTPVISYDGASTFPASPGHYTAKAIVADPTYFGFRATLINVSRPTATLTLSNTNLPYTGSVGTATVTTSPAGLATQVSIVGQGILPGTYPITAWINDPAYNYTPVTGTMTISGLVVSTPDDLTVSGNSSGAIVNFAVSAGDGFTATTPALASPASGSLFPVGTTTVNVTATDTGGQIWSKSFTVTVFPGPSQLQQVNPSAGVAPGTVEILSNTSVRIVGAGGTTAGGATADLYTGSNDSNTYLSMPWTGDGNFTARLTSFTSSAGTASKAGIIFRETTSAGSRYSSIYMIPTSGGAVTYQHKTATNGSTTGTNFFTGATNNRGFPQWLRMTRRGDTFAVSYSDNGTAWTEVSSQPNAMTGATISVGFVVAPRLGNTSATATFDNISFLALPAATAGLTATASGTNVNLAWSTVTDAATYSVKRGPSPGGPYTTLTSTLTTASYSDTTATAGSTAYYIITATNAVGEGPASVEVSALPATPQQSWRYQYFGTTANTSTAADLVDANNDGEVNLLEFATAQSPLAATRTTPALVKNGATFEFTYPRSKAAMSDGVTFTVEWSDTLAAGSWSSAGVTEQILSDNGTVQSVKASVAAGATRRFVHLKVTKP